MKFVIINFNFWMKDWINRRKHKHIQIIQNEIWPLKRKSHPYQRRLHTRARRANARIRRHGLEAKE